MRKKASVIAIGNEILMGEITDTNSTFISRKLFEKGILTVVRLQIPDKREDIEQALRFCMEKSNIIITTGGLGPTNDDITKKTIANFLGRDLVLVDDLKNWVEGFFQRRGIPMSDVNLSQAEIIEGSRYIMNPIGTAPAIIINVGKKKIAMFPGVPSELYVMFDKFLEGIEGSIPVTTLLRTIGIAESDIYNEVKKDAPQKIQKIIYYYPTWRGVDLRIVSYDIDLQKDAVNFLKHKFGNYIYSLEEKEIEEIVGIMLRNKGISISVAESCTGGLVADYITDVPGSSDYFIGGVVTYSNKSKINILGVRQNDIDRFGAVSEIVAREMAEGVKSLFNADIGVSTTGIAGPTGERPGKPLGLVYMAVSYKNETIVKKQIFLSPRKRVKVAAATFLLNMVREVIKG